MSSQAIITPYQVSRPKRRRNFPVFLGVCFNEGSRILFTHAKGVTEVCTTAAGVHCAFLTCSAKSLSSSSISASLVATLSMKVDRSTASETRARHTAGKCPPPSGSPPLASLPRHTPKMRPQPPLSLSDGTRNRLNNNFTSKQGLFWTFRKKLNVDP